MTLLLAIAVLAAPSTRAYATIASVVSPMLAGARRGAPRAVHDYVAVAKTLHGDEGLDAVQRKAEKLGRPSRDSIKSLDDGSTARFITWMMRATTSGPTTHVHLSTGFYRCQREFGPSWCLIHASVVSCSGADKCSTMYEMPLGTH